MSTGGSAKIVASCVGLTGFAVAMIAGVGADNPLDITITRALLSMLVCTITGAIVGAAADVAMSGAIEQLHRTGGNPTSSETKQLPNDTGASVSAKQVTS